MEEGGGHGREWRGRALHHGPRTSPPAASPSDVPSAPLLLAVEDVSESSVAVSWEPPERLGKLGFQGYVLELRREGGEPWAEPCIYMGGGEGSLHGGRDKPPDPAVGSVQGDIQKEEVEAAPSTHSPQLLLHQHTPEKRGVARCPPAPESP